MSYAKKKIIEKILWKEQKLFFVANIFCTNIHSSVVYQAVKDTDILQNLKQWKHWQEIGETLKETAETPRKT